MSQMKVEPRAASWLTTGLLSVSIIGLLVAFAKAPAIILRTWYPPFDDPTYLADSVARNLVSFWDLGQPGLTSDFQVLVQYWLFWHLIKSVICLLLLVVVAALTVNLGRRYISSSRRSAPMYAILQGIMMVIATVVVVVLLANLQSVATPFVSLLQVLPRSAAEAAISSTISEITSELSGPTSSLKSASLSTLISQVGQYHWVLAALSAAGLIILLISSILTWKKVRQRGDSDRRRKGLFVIRLAGVCLIASVLLIAGVVSTISAVAPIESVMDIL